jgi:hypothetical protein
LSCDINSRGSAVGHRATSWTDFGSLEPSLTFAIRADGKR